MISFKSIDYLMSRSSLLLPNVLEHELLGELLKGIVFEKTTLLRGRAQTSRSHAQSATATATAGSYPTRR